MSPPDAARAKPHHDGHRARLRARFAEAGPDSVADYELMELVLFRAIPRRDVKLLAKTLITRFGGFAEAIGQPVERLKEVPGVSDAVALELKIVQAAGRKLAQERVARRDALSSFSDVVAHVRAAMADENREQFRVLFLDKKNRLIGDEVLGAGTIDQAPVYPREIMRRAIALDATALILVHNHPSGDPTPSGPDMAMTREVVEIAKGLGVVVHDHLIVGRDQVASFRHLGLM